MAKIDYYTMTDLDLTDVVSRITEYLDSGGLWNPELADHAAVRDLILDARDEIDRLRRIIVAMPNPIARKMLDRDGIDEASDEQWREAVDDANRAICASVAAAEQEVGRE